MLLIEPISDKFFVFFFSRNVLVSLSFLKGSLVDTEFIIDHPFLSKLKVPSRLQSFWEQVSYSSFVDLLYARSNFSLVDRKSSLIDINFHKVDYDVPRYIDHFGFTLLGLQWVSWMCYFSANLGCFLPLFLHYFCLFFFYSMMPMLAQLMVSQISVKVLFILIFCFLNWIIFTKLSSSYWLFHLLIHSYCALLINFSSQL